MKQFIVISAALALAACNNTQTDETVAPADPATATTTVDAMNPGDAGFEAVAPGNYQVTQADGSVDELIIQPGMTWSRVAADGSATGGTIFAQAGKTCFVTEGVAGNRCFTDGQRESDGSMKVTADDGTVATVKPVAAAPTGATPPA